MSTVVKTQIIQDYMTSNEMDPGQNKPLISYVLIRARKRISK